MIGKVVKLTLLLTNNRQQLNFNKRQFFKQTRVFLMSNKFQ
jgi:hypothetical protein